MTGRIDFSYDAENDVVIARPAWTIATEEDCEAWFRQWVDYLSPFGRKLDCIVVLDDFYVETQVASRWGEYRARLTNDYHRFSCRVHSNWNVRAAVLASGTRHNVAASEAESVMAAMDRIRAARRQAGVPDEPATESPSRRN